MGALSGSTRPSRLLGAVLAVGLVASPAALLGTSPASAVPEPAPSLKLFSTSAGTEPIEISRPAGQRAWLSLPVWATPTSSDFDLKITRPNFRTPISVTQVVHHGDGSTTEIARPEIELDNWRGLPDFFDLTVTNGAGDVVRSSSLRFCPNGGEQQRRLPDSVDTSTFPRGCSGMPFMYGNRWGINEGWAGGVARGLSLKAPAGRYTVTVSIADDYRSALGIAPADATVSTRYRLVNGRYDEHGRQAVARADAAPDRAPAPAPAPEPRAKAPIDETPDEAHLPDLRTMPAFGMRTGHARGKDWLSFGANVWVGGNSLLDIEGFRRADEEVMDAWQYFYDGDEPVGRSKVGEMEYDTRDGHFHWHLLQFARYRLLDADKAKAVRSSKQSFCIVPTDPVDLSLDNAEMAPYETGLDSACGERSALWIRETLPLGWGDTYYQGKGGQAFNITNLPNGTYFVSVEANPTNELFEIDKENNVSQRKVILKGRPGNRSVCVPAVFGIDGHGACATPR